MLFTNISFTYNFMFFQISRANMEFMIIWYVGYVAPAFLSPNDITVYQYNPLLVMKEVFSWSGVYILIWLYPKYASMQLTISWPAVTCTNWLIMGRRKLYLEQALLRIVKSVHIRHFSFAFFTNTILDNHWRYWISLMNLAFSKSSTWLAMISFHS